MNPLILHDLPFRVLGRTLSPYVWKAKLALNYKNIPYTTVWYEHSDVEARAKEIGAAPTGVKSDGGPFYTFPILQDPNTGKVISDSSAIIEYLDDTYPDTPRLIPKGCETLHRAFREFFLSKLKPMWQFAIALTHDVLPPRAQAHCRIRWEASWGMKVHEICPKGSKRDEEWAKFEKAMREVDFLMHRDQKFIMGDCLSASDLDIAGFLLGWKGIWGIDSPEWKDVSTWHDGRWGRLVKNVEPYMSG